MSSYDIFATYYDSLTKNVDYTGRAEYLLKLLQKFNHCAGITLDLACGTGSLTLELYRRKIDVYGVDSSLSMLSQAKDKAYDEGADILFLCQKIQSLDLYGTVDTVFCCLDSINHLKSLDEIQKGFQRVSLFMNPGGYFIFDFNTLYKHKHILANNTYVYDVKDVFCVWQNSLNNESARVDISLDFFEKQGGMYARSSERFYEITCELSYIKEMLVKAGFEDVSIFGDMSFEKPSETCERAVFAARKAF